MNSLWRSTDVRWLKELLKNGEVRSKNGRYISFSKKEDSGGHEDFGDVCIEFDANTLYKQGAIDIEYNPEFMERHKDICLYVTGYRDRTHYEDAHDPADENELSWETCIEDYEEEAEVVLKNLKYKDGLVKSVYDCGTSSKRSIRNEGPVDFHFLGGTKIKINK